MVVGMRMCGYRVWEGREEEEENESKKGKIEEGRKWGMVVGMRMV